MYSRNLDCSNCLASKLIRIPFICSSTSNVNYQDFSICRNKLSGHKNHITTLKHMCDWHSTLVSQDNRYNKEDFKVYIED